MPEAIASTQPWFGQLPWHGGPFRSITMCPSSPAGPDRAAVELAAQDQPAADAGADREHHGLAATARRAGAMLGQRREVGVVVDEHRQAEPLGHHVGEHDVLEREVHGDHRGAGPLIDQAGDAEADRGDLPAGAGARLLDRVDDDVEEVGRRRGG